MKDEKDYIASNGGVHRGAVSDSTQAAGISRKSGRPCRISIGICVAAGLLTFILWGCKGNESEVAVSAKKDSTLVDLVPKVGEPFPYTQFIGGDGQVVDLARATDRKYSLVVFMRGFAGFVCPYCTAQTAELLDRHNEIQSTQTQLFIAYPGPADTIPQFLDAVRDYMKSDDDSASVVPLFMDVDLKAVDALGIRHQLARPSSFILDAKGGLVYAYIGKDPSDRPALDDILRVLKTAPDGQKTDGK